MKKIEWTNGNKMKIETGHKGFDSACSAIFTGNAWTDTQTSSYIRPMTEIECNGLVKPIGHLLLETHGRTLKLLVIFDL